LSRIGATPDEGDEMRLRRSVVLMFATVMSLAGLVWGIFTYLFYDRTLALLPPFGYGLLSLLNVILFARTGQFRRFRFIQLAASLLLPFLMMLLLGGLVQGSATILWSLIAPLGALLVANRRQATGWFIAFLVLVLISALLEPTVNQAVTITPEARTLFFAMNIVGPLTAAFGLLHRFWRQKEEILAENVRLLRNMRRQATEMTSLAEIGNDILATLDLDQLLGRITGHARELLAAHNCAIYLVRPDTRTLRLIACAGEIPAAVKAFEPRVGQGIIGDVAQTGVAEIVSDTSTDPRRVTLPNVSAARQAEKLMVAPLFSRQAVIGVMSIWRPAGKAPFDAADLHVLESLTRLASIAITNARLYEETAAARAAAVAANEAKSAFLATMSHEIRTPMNAVIGMTSLLLDTPQTAEQREFTETIRSSGEMLLLLINDILDFSKIEAGQLELEKRPFSVRDAVEASLDLMAVRAAEKRLDLAYTIAPETPETIVGDVTRLRQILINLLSNSIKFTEQGEVVIAIHAEPLPGTDAAYLLHFAVRDTGIGIPADRMDRLFRSFSQVDASTTRTYGGTGLGLAICKRLSELMGGSIAVESRLGEGSVFTFTIQAEVVAGPERAFLQDVQPHLAGRRLLIVADSPTNRRILQRQAEAWGMTACTVAASKDALAELCRDAPFDAAVLDMQMPEMDGLALAAELRSVQQGKDLPLLLLTSLGGLTSEQRPLAEATFAATLTKPVKPSLLYDTLLHIFLGRPLQPQQETAVSQSEFDPQMGQRLPLRILLVDDNSTNQKLGVRLLQRLGYRVDVAGNGLEALTAVQRQPYDVVFMDVQMPVMDGLEATRRMRQMALPQPYVVATTADVLMDERIICRAAGMDDFLAKPIRVQALRKTLEQAAQNRASLAIQVTLIDEETAVAPPPIDLETAVDAAALVRLQEMMGGEPAYLYELIDGFLAEAPQLLAQMQRGLAAQDAATIRLAAHSLKANVADFGAARLHELTVQVEALAKQGDLADLSALLAAMTEAYTAVEKALRQVRSGQRTDHDS
jgi:signal transduction histidine kinase/CheY-like chemotaxis protein/HPt (histidine-containing phosphotransfer) domain-containing protein